MFIRCSEMFQSPIGWGLSCDVDTGDDESAGGNGFNPLLVGV